MDEINMTYIMAVIGTILRVIMMDGYMAMPRYENGRLQLNIVGTVIVSLIGTFAAMQAMPALFATPFGALVAAYSSSYAVDRVVTKLTPNPEEPTPETQ